MIVIGRLQYEVAVRVCSGRVILVRSAWRM